MLSPGEYPDPEPNKWVIWKHAGEVSAAKVEETMTHGHPDDPMPGYPTGYEGQAPLARDPDAADSDLEPGCCAPRYEVALDVPGLVSPTLSNVVGAALACVRAALVSADLPRAARYDLYIAEARLLGVLRRGDEDRGAVP